MDVANSRTILNKYDPLSLLEDYADVLWLVENTVQFGSFSSDKNKDASRYLLGTHICIQLDLYEFPKSLYRFRQNVAIARNGECAFEFLAKMIDFKEEEVEHMVHEQIKNGLTYNRRKHRSEPSPTRKPDPDSLAITFWTKFKSFSDEIRTEAKEECTRLLKEGFPKGLKESVYMSIEKSASAGLTGYSPVCHNIFLLAREEQ